MQNLTDWFNTNKISQNVQKTELEKTKIDRKVKISKLSRKRLYPRDSVKYLGIRIYEILNRKHHVTDTAINLN